MSVLLTRSETFVVTPPLRPYQQDAVTATLDALRQGEHPVLALPTGSGKSHIIAALCAALPGRVLVVTHRKELIRQDRSKHAGEDAGIYSAGLRQRDLDHRVLYAGVASIYRRMEILQRRGMFDTIIVDEVHRVPPPDTSSMYRAIFGACPDAQRIGLSATPYRLNEGVLWGDGQWFTMRSYAASIAALTPTYLAPLVGVLTAHDIDVSAVRTRAGEFVSADLAQAACEEAAVEGACAELCALAVHRQHWLVFCVDKAHTRLVAASLTQRGILCAVLTEDTPRGQRDALLDDFQQGRVRALVNCEILTTGFDAPCIDCIVVLRPTQSRGLVVQMLGRGSRQAPGKRNAVILDFAGNLERHLPLDGLPEFHRSPARVEADAERERQAATERERQVHHRTRAGLDDPMAQSPQPGTLHTYAVQHISYRVLASRKNPQRSMLLVTYLCTGRLPARLTHFVCLEHEGYPRTQAVAWCLRRGIRMYQTARAALAHAWHAPQPVSIVVREDAQWPRIVMEHFAIDNSVNTLVQ